MTPRPRYLSLAVLACIVGTGGLHAATEPIDWKLLVNVSPMDRFFRPTSDDRIRVLLQTQEQPGCFGLGFPNAPVITGTMIRFQGRRGVSGVEPCTPSPVSDEFELPRLPAAAGGRLIEYTIEVYDEDLLIRSQPLEVRDPIHEVTLVGPILVSVRLTDPRAGDPRPAAGVPLSAQSAYFWFFDPDNIEVTVKVVDGRQLNGHLWVFLASSSDLRYTVTVSRQGCFPNQCPTKAYVNRPDRRLNVADTTTF